MSGINGDFPPLVDEYCSLLQSPAILSGLARAIRLGRAGTQVCKGAFAPGGTRPAPSRLHSALHFPHLARIVSFTSPSWSVEYVLHPPAAACVCLISPALPQPGGIRPGRKNMRGRDNCSFGCEASRWTATITPPSQTLTQKPADAGAVTDLFRAGGHCNGLLGKKTTVVVLMGGILFNPFDRKGDGSWNWYVEVVLWLDTELHTSTYAEQVARDSAL
ncbi:hypothetical protein N658DRAFT_231887 [Parathielavia hyrcaniae]|uniref:Uncharacterized protein n=1 Tax=Parathielavia hyrcaniae TaxID=113614 RepID=A0AAN6Q599_9PEZI|nr:hypothetical protein N658DRAFT_231887 [Parathielavia hyrcaniae]